MGDNDQTEQGSEEKPSSTGCCGLSFLKRPHGLRPKQQPTDRQKGTQNHKDTADGKDNHLNRVNTDNKDIEDTEASNECSIGVSKDSDPCSPHTNPLNLAGITLNLNITTTTTTRTMDTSNRKTDNRLEEFKQLFCGGNELHSVDFIRIWGFYDKDHSGYLESKELDKFIKDLILQKGEKPYPDMVKDVREAVLRSADINQDGRIELSEFARCLPVEKNFLLKFDNSRNVMSRKEFNEIFKHYDPDGNGVIEGHEILALLRDILTKLGVQAGARELEEYRDNVIKIYDKNADGKLSRDELGMLLSVDK